MRSYYEQPPTSAADVQDIVNRQRDYFNTHITLDVNMRLRNLGRLLDYLKAHEAEALQALTADLGKSAFEGYATELGLVYEEIRLMLKKARTWARPRRVSTPLENFPATSTVYANPFGVVAVLSPWNYPLQLSLIPLVDAVAAGNTIVLKPSKTSVHTSAFLQQMCRTLFDERYIFCLHGSDQMNDWLLKVVFDKIMFTGSPRVGREIMHHAADSLTDITLELGGKSPVFIAPDANIRRAAQRIVWGKCLNSGQTCVGPDFALVHADVMNIFVDEFARAVHAFYGERPMESPDYSHMINQHHFQRVCSLIDDRNPNARITCGGGRDEDTLQIEPTLITGVKLSDPVMDQEIFGPVLPVLTWHELDEAFDITRSYPHPLALYIFSESRRVQQEILDSVPSGGATINDVVIHASSNKMGFGGLQNSGIGAYHGKTGFDAFTHYRSTMTKTTLFEIPVRTPPFDPMKMGILKLLMH